MSPNAVITATNPSIDIGATLTVQGNLSGPDLVANGTIA